MNWIKLLFSTKSVRRQRIMVIEQNGCMAHIEVVKHDGYLVRTQKFKPYDGSSNPKEYTLGYCKSEDGKEFDVIMEDLYDDPQRGCKVWFR